MPDRVGQQIEQYRLLRLLGEGGFGYVYLAENMFRKNQVAIKLLKLQLSTDEFPIFLNEARIFRLRHPHIVPVLDFGIEQSTSTPFLVMNYAPHGTLRQRHPKGSRLQPSLVLPYIKAVAEALQYAHEEDLIHRDVKPENMLIGHNQEIMLSDFGIATASYSGRIPLARTKEFIRGTYNYMAPEQFQGRPCSASDQYALGIVAYEWLSGSYPFAGTFYEVAAQHLHTLPPPLRARGISISAGVEQVIMKALAKDIKQRFDSVYDFALSLEEALLKEERRPEGRASLRGRAQKRDREPQPRDLSVANQVPGPGIVHPQEPYPIVRTPHEILLEEGHNFYRARRYEEAIRAYGRVIQLMDRHVEAHYQRGSSYFQLKLYQPAISDFEQTISLDPLHAMAYYAKALAFYNLELYQRALIDFNWVIQLHPGDAELYSRRGSTYHRLGQYQLALSDFDQAVALNTHDSGIYFKRGLTYLKLKHYQQAIYDFDRALALDPGNVLVYHYRGSAYEQQMGQYQLISPDIDQMPLDQPPKKKSRKQEWWDR